MFSAQPANLQPQPLGEEPIQQENPQNSRPSFIKYVKLWQIVVLLVLLIPTTAYFLSKNQTAKQISTVQPSQTPIPTPNPTANWKTYANNNYGFSIKAPSKYYFENNSNGTLLKESNPPPSREFNPGFSILVSTITSVPSDPLTLFGKYGKITYGTASLANKSYAVTPIGGMNGYMVTDIPVGVSGISKEIIIIKGNYLYDVTIEGTGILKSSEADQILSTFTFASLSTSKFTNQTNNYFNIPELGIRIKLTDEIKDLGYIYKNNAPYFYTDYLIEQAKEKGGTNYCTKDAGPIGTFLKIEKTSLKNDQNGPWDETIQGIRAETVGKNGFPPLAKEFPSYFLFFSHPNNTCSNDNSIGLLQQKQANLLQESMQTAELTQ